MTFRSNKFLHIFNTPEAATTSATGNTTTSAPSVSPQPPAAPVSVPVSALPAVIDLAAAMAARQQASQQLSSAQSQPAPAPAPAEPPQNNDELASLRREVARTNKQLEQMILESYRLTAINNARASGQDLIDSLVGGRSQQEIDASVQFAVAEYQLLKQQILAKVPTPAPAPAAVEAPPAPIPTPAPEPTPAPQATVTNATPPAPPAAPSLPGYVSAPSVPEAANVITPEQLAYLTSPEAVRNGDYMKYRHMLQRALPNAAGNVPRNWSFNANGPGNLMPQQAPTLHPSQSVYSGVTFPNMRPVGTQPTPPVHAGLPAPAIRQIAQPQQVTSAPTAAGAQFLAPDGTPYSQGGVPVTVAGAREAAEAAINARRGTV